MGANMEFTYSIKEDAHEKIVILNCDLFDITTHISYLIHTLYNRMARHQPAMAAVFREMITDTITNPDSACWTLDDEQSGAVDIFFTTPKKGDECNES